MSFSSSSEDDILVEDNESNCFGNTVSDNDGNNDGDDDDESIISDSDVQLEDECENNSDEEWTDDFKEEEEANNTDIVEKHKPINVRNRQSRIKLSEKDRSFVCLSDENIIALLSKCRCVKTRMSNSCPNDFKCANSLGGVLDAKNIIKSFRKKFYTYTENNKTNNIVQRRISLLRELEVLSVEKDGKRSIDYKISGHKVCKDFFFEASAISKRMFRDAVSYVLGARTSEDIQRFFNKANIEYSTKKPKKVFDQCSEITAEHAVKFLHHYFTYSVDWSPNERGVRYIHFTFTHLYKTYYLFYCEVRKLVPVPLFQFYRIRKYYCPKYRKSKTIRPGGWNHVRCDTCDRLQREITRCEEGSSECLAKQKEFLLHVRKQDMYRAIYTKRIKKATSRKRRTKDIIMAVDGAGGAGSKNLPRMITQEKNEPSRQKMLKLKLTFSIIHGVGTYIWSSYPTLGCQGGNLTLEIIYRGIRAAMIKKEMSTLETLYVQVDNTSANKCFTVIIGLAALVALGICDKVVLSFLLLGHTHTDVDRIIGLVVSSLRRKDIATFEELEQYVMTAYTVSSEQDQIATPPVRGFQHIISMTDYDLLFKGVADEAKKRISSVSASSMWKMVLNETGDGVKIIYKDDSSKPGWLPRPVLSKYRSAAWNKYFTKTAYFPNKILSCHPRKTWIKVNGISQRRPEWIYDVEDTNGEVNTYSIPVQSLPFPPFPDDLLDSVRNAAPQCFRGKLLLRQNQSRILTRIETLLTKRGKNSPAAMASWNAFFARLPKKDEPTYSAEHPRILSQLAENYGFKREKFVGPIILDEHDDGDYGVIDSVAYKDGPISIAEHTKFRRENFREGDKLAVRKLRNGNDDSESDVSKDYDRPIVAKKGRKRLATSSIASNSDKQRQPALKRSREAAETSESQRIFFIDCMPNTQDDQPKSKYKPSDDLENINIDSCAAIIDSTVGESVSGRFRLRIARSTRAARIGRVSFPSQLASILRCKSESELLDLIKKDFNLTMFYKGDCYLYDSVKGDGLCGARLAYILSLLGGIVADTLDERSAVKKDVESKDVKLENNDSRLAFLAWLENLMRKLTHDVMITNLEYKTKLIGHISAMIKYVGQEVPQRLESNVKLGIFTSDEWLSKDSMVIISAMLGFKCTVFNESHDFEQPRSRRGKDQSANFQWYKAMSVGDGVDPNRLLSNGVFSYEVCRAVTSHPVFCILTGELHGHFVPMPCHLRSLLHEYENEAVPSLVQRVWRKLKDARKVFNKRNGTKVLPVLQEASKNNMSELEMTRQENIKRNEEFLSNLGFGNMKCNNTKLSGSTISSSSDADSSDGENSSTSDVDSSSSYGSEKMTLQSKSTSKQPMSKGSKPSNAEAAGDVVDITCDDMSAKIQRYVYLTGTTHYDPGPAAKDKGVFKCISVDSYEFNNGNMIVVYRSKYNEMTRLWGEPLMDEPQCVDYIESLHKNAKNVKRMNNILML